MSQDVIRRLNTADAEAWAGLRRQALEQHPLAFGASVPDDPAVLVETARARLAPGDDAVVFGAYRDDALHGIVGVRRFDGVKERHKVMIWGMYVAAASRRGGIGEMLMRAAIDHARSMPDVEQVRLAVSSSAPEAQRLYTRLGFREWGREPRALCVDGTYADETHMVLDLT